MKPGTLWTDLLDLFLPRGCLGCGDRIPPEAGSDLVCVRCRTLLRPPPSPRCLRCDVPLGTAQPPGVPCLECQDWPPVLASARAAVVMEPPADSLVHALKYLGWRPLGEIMGLRMAGIFPTLADPPVLVPVPTTPGRRRVRGYDQARVLAQIIAGKVGRPVVQALSRPEGRTQVNLGPRARRKNVRGAFALDPDHRSRIRGREVILIDDVLTTGATAISAARVLGEGGAAGVHLLTFARALPFASERRRAPVV